jgi:hypothetical protein
MRPRFSMKKTVFTDSPAASDRFPAGTGIHFLGVFILQKPTGYKVPPDLRLGGRLGVSVTFKRWVEAGISYYDLKSQHTKEALRQAGPLRLWARLTPPRLSELWDNNRGEGFHFAAEVQYDTRVDDERHLFPSVGTFWAIVQHKKWRSDLTAAFGVSLADRAVQGYQVGASWYLTLIKSVGFQLGGEVAAQLPTYGAGPVLVATVGVRTFEKQRMEREAEGQARNTAEHLRQPASTPTSTGAGAGASSGPSGQIRIIEIHRSEHPQTAAHIEAAQCAGQPITLTIDRAGIAARRRQSLKGADKEPGQDRDEYPPAMFKEGGTGASVQSIDPKDNRGAGAIIGNQCRDLPDGAKVIIKVVP